MKKIIFFLSFILIFSNNIFAQGFGDFAPNKASKIKITDSGGYYTGTEVETALQEIGVAGFGGITEEQDTLYSVVNRGSVAGGDISASNITITSTASPQVVHATSRIDLGSSNFATIQKDASHNLVFYDEITGSKTLASLIVGGTSYTASGTLLNLTGTIFSVNEGTLTTTKGCKYVSGTGLVCDQDYITAETDPTVDSSAEIQAIIGAGVYEPAGVAVADITDASANGRSLISAANYSTMRGLLDLEAGTDFYSIAAADILLAAKQGTLTNSAGLLAALNDETGSASGTPLAVFNQAPAIDGNIKNTPYHLRFTILDPLSAQTESATICIVPKLDAAITITNLEVTLDAAANEVAGDIKYADAFIGLANATVINDFDTTSGVRSDSSITSGAVAAGKCIYLSFDSAPNTAIHIMSVDLTYDYD